MIRVQVIRQDELIGDETSSLPTCFIGKDSGSLILLSGWRIGRRQAQFHFNEDGLFITDGGGLSPIKVNGNAVNEYGRSRPRT